MTYTNDPHRDFLNHENEKEKWLTSRPECDMCGEKIQEEVYIELDAIKYCPDCWDDFVNANLVRHIEED